MIWGPQENPKAAAIPWSSLNLFLGNHENEFTGQSQDIENEKPNKCLSEVIMIFGFFQCHLIPKISHILFLTIVIEYQSKKEVSTIWFRLFCDALYLCRIFYIMNWGL